MQVSKINTQQINSKPAFYGAIKLPDANNKHAKALIKTFEEEFSDYIEEIVTKPGIDKNYFFNYQRAEDKAIEYLNKLPINDYVHCKNKFMTSEEFTKFANTNIF